MQPALSRSVGAYLDVPALKYMPHNSWGECQILHGLKLSATASMHDRHATQVTDSSKHMLMQAELRDCQEQLAKERDRNATQRDEAVRGQDQIRETQRELEGAWKKVWFYTASLM